MSTLRGVIRAIAIAGGIVYLAAFLIAEFVGQ